MRVPLLGLALIGSVGCSSPSASLALVGVANSVSSASSSGGSTSTGGVASTGASTTTAGTTAGTTTGTSGGSSSSTSGGSGGGCATATATTTGGNRFACHLGDGGLFAAPYAVDGLDASGQWAESPAVEIGDANGDGNLDFVVADYTGDLALVLGNGDGTFQPAEYASVDPNVTGLRLAQLGNPTKSVTVVARQNDVSGQLYFLQIQPLGVQNAFPTITRYAYGLSVADLNCDGWPDLVAPGYNTTAVYLGGAAGFTELADIPAEGEQTPLADFNEDGILDFIGARWDPDPYGGLFIYLGNGDGTFQAGQQLVTGGYQAYFVGDLNEDGHLDLLVIRGAAPPLLLLGIGNGTFTVGPIPSVGNAGFALVDLNGDGHLDYVEFVNQLGFGIALGNGDGSFQPELLISVQNDLADVQFGDVNNDGRPDMLATYQGSSSVEVRLNNCQ